MKNFTPLLFLSLSMILISATLNAQTNWQKKKAKQEVNKIKINLDLDDDMTAKIYDIYLATMVELKKTKEAGEMGILSKKEQKVASKKIWKRNTSQIEEVLGEDLAKEYRIFRRKMRAAKE